MAGLGTKLWTSGEVVTATGVNGYLQDQVIGTYASTSARDAAFGGAGEPTLSEGMFAYTTDTNTLWLYTGSTNGWVNVLGSNIGQISTSNRNILINGGFSVWQRGTSGAGYVSSGGFVADRWQGIRGAAAAGMTMYQITGTSTEIPNNQYVMRLQRDSGNTSTQDIRLFYSAETLDSMSLVGQSVTISFYVRKGSNYSGGDVTATVYSGTGTDQNLGLTGFTGTTAVATATRTSATLTTGFTRVSATGTVATSAKQLGLIISYTPTGTAGANDFIDIWGIQLEAGSVATPFEFENYSETLAKCQRYYCRIGGTSAGLLYPALAFSTTGSYGTVRFPQTMRTAVTAVEASATVSNYALILNNTGTTNLNSAFTLNYGFSDSATLSCSIGAANLVQGNITFVFANNSSGYLGFSAEL
jgi:hypothetical protein